MVALDIETTGLNKDLCGIVQISLAKFDKDFNIVDKYNTYLTPPEGTLWTKSAVDLTSITKKDVEGSPKLSEIAGIIIDFIGDEDILVYNGVSFDIPFLQSEFNKYNLKFIDLSNRNVYDSYNIECAIDSRKLGNVFTKYTGKSMEDSGLDAHNSMSDVLATIEVFKNQSKKYDVNQYKSSSKNDIISEEDGDVTLLIGKYRGVSLYEVVKIDPNYVAYLIKHSKDRHLFEVVKKIYDQIKKEEKTTK